MINQALFDVVKNQLAGGVSDQEIMEFLRRRGVDDVEIKELFEAVSPNAPALSDIPVPVVHAEQVLSVNKQSIAAEAETKETTPIMEAAKPVNIPVPFPVTSEAHGVVREIPPLQPSAPFAVSNTVEQGPVLKASGPIAETPVVQQPIPVVTSGITLPPVGGRKRLTGIIAAIVIGAGLLVGGGLYAYTAYFASSEAVMDRMINNLFGLRSATFSGEATITTNEVESLAASTTNPFAGMFAIQGPVTATIKTSGLLDMIDVSQPKLLIAFDATMDKWPLGDFVLGAEYRNLDRMSYVKFDTVPDLGFFSVSFLKNKWFMIKDQEAKSQLGVADASNSVLPTVTEEQRAQLSIAWQENRFLAVRESLGGEMLDGVSTRHYTLAFDPDAFKRWSIKADEIMGNPVSDVATLDEALARITVEDMQIWIGRRDGLPHKVSIQASMRSERESGRTSAVTVVLAGNNFNQPIDITVPEGAKPVEEALQGIFGQMLGKESGTTPLTTPSARNKQRRKDVSAIADAIKKNMADNNGSFVCAAGSLPIKATFLGATGPGGVVGYAIESCLAPKYLQAMPRDPSKGSFATSAYSAFYDPKTKWITVRAPYAEGGVKISVIK